MNVNGVFIQPMSGNHHPVAYRFMVSTGIDGDWWMAATITVDVTVTSIITAIHGVLSGGDQFKCLVINGHGKGNQYWLAATKWNT